MLLRAGQGVMLRREAAAAGISDPVLREEVRRREIASLMRGAFCRSTPVGVDEHRRMLSIAALRQYPDAQLSSSAAVAAWSVPVVGVPAVRLDVARPVRQEVLTQHLRLRPTRHDAQESALGPADPLANALVQMAMDVGVLAALPSVDAALHAGLVTTAELEAVFEEVKGWPRSSQARCTLAWADGRSESPGESLTRAHLRAVGISTTPQQLITAHDGTVVARVDLEVDGAPVVIEFDGKVKYAGDDGPEALFREKKREDRVRRLGYLVVRVVWADLHDPLRMIAEVRQAIHDAGVRLPASPD